MSDDFGVSKKLEAKLKKSDSDVQNFIIALQKKQAKFKKEIGDLEVENMSLRDDIKTLSKAKEQAESEGSLKGFLDNLTKEDYEIMRPIFEKNSAKLKALENKIRG
jgi:CRISPR/Cas system CMR-associated protein Cmr1 (group 7 of RAMP superfamily)